MSGFESLLKVLFDSMVDKYAAKDKVHKVEDKRAHTAVSACLLYNVPGTELKKRFNRTAVLVLVEHTQPGRAELLLLDGMPWLEDGNSVVIPPYLLKVRLVVSRWDDGSYTRELTAHDSISRVPYGLDLMPEAKYIDTTALCIEIMTMARELAAPFARYYKESVAA